MGRRGAGRGRAEAWISAVRGRTGGFTGRAEFITSHSDADPDLSSSFADAVNQVQYTYTASGAMDKEYQEHEGKVVVGCTASMRTMRKATS